MADRTRILVPDTPWAKEVAWDGLPVDLVYYDPSESDPDVDPQAGIMIVGPGDHTAAYRLADQLPSLRYIQTTYAGVDNWDGRLRPGIRLHNTRGALGPVTAEIMTAGILAMLRGIPRFVTSQARCKWDPFQAETLWRRTVTIVGAGDVGRALQQQLAAFGAQVSLVGRTTRAGVHPMSDLDSLARRSTVLVAATPLTAETRGLIGRQLLAALREGAIVGNVARGMVIDAEALLAELRRGRLRAVLDVTDPEPLPPDHELWSMPNVLITPHVGGMIHSAIVEGMRHAVQAVGNYMRDHATSPDRHR